MRRRAPRIAATAPWTAMAVALAGLGAGCGDDANADGGAADMAPALDLVAAAGDMARAVPPAPAVGAQIDRAGRPGMTTLLLDPLDLDGGKDMLRNTYNRDGDRAGWRATWRARFGRALALLDGLDAADPMTMAKGCGNQLGADDRIDDPSRYDRLALLLADDRLYLDAARASCRGYLAIEAEVLGLTATECGGRNPLVDVVDASLTALIAGVSSFGMDSGFAVTDGVAADADGAPSLTEFPFLRAPK